MSKKSLHLQGPSYDKEKVLEAFGKKRHEVIELLGEPYDKGCCSKKYKTSSCFVYGVYEVFFYPWKNGTCYCIMDGITHEVFRMMKAESE